MKTTRILSYLAGALLLLGSCATEDIQPGAQTGNPSVRLSLGGSAKKSVTRATVEAENGEKTVNSLLAVLFDTHNGFYKTVEARPAGDEYEIIVEDDATYDIYLVANADTNMKTALENIPAGTPATDADNGLEAVVADQAPDADGQFLMVSRFPERVTTSITKTESIGEVHMQRLAARFDVVNKADGVTVTKVTYNNRAVKASVATRNEMPTDADWFESTKDYTPDGGLVGSKENPATFDHTVYSYENYTAKGGDKLPTLTIEYTENGQTKTHDVALIDPAATDMTPLAVKRNHLYRIILTKAYKLDFELEVLDWDDSEEFQITDLPLELDPDIQDELNSRLMVNMFTEYNVKSLDIANKKVEFMDKLHPSVDEMTPDNYFAWPDLFNAGVLSEGETGYIHDSEGKKYRVPTIGEFQLLVPQNTAYTSFRNQTDENNRTITAHANWSISSTSVLPIETFEEYIRLKNENSNFIKYTSDYDFNEVDEHTIKGSTILRRGRITQSINTVGDFQYLLENQKTYYLCACYGIRFKGTKEYAAYKWENLSVDGSANNRYLSIKIKALPMDSDIDINDIVDNHSFWAQGYIEYILPNTGWISEQGNQEIEMASESRLWSTSRYTSNYSFFLRSALWAAYPGREMSKMSKLQLRLVKVEE